MKWEPGNHPPHLPPPCHPPPSRCPTQKVGAGWPRLPGRGSGPTASCQHESCVTTFEGQPTVFFFFLTDPRVTGLLCKKKKSIHWPVLLVFLPECLPSSPPQGPRLKQARHLSQGPLHGPPSGSAPPPFPSHLSQRGILHIISAQGTHANP